MPEDKEWLNNGSKKIQSFFFANRRLKEYGICLWIYLFGK